MKIGIIGAMPEEITLIRDQMGDCTTCSVYGLEFAEGALGGHDVVVVVCGVGKVNAAMCALTLVERFDVERIVFTGVAGSLDAAVDFFDIVVSTDCVQHDYDVSTVFPDEETAFYVADETLRAAAVRAVYEAAPDVGLHEGRIASGDQFVGDAATKERIASTFGALCCEMEGAAVAQVACKCGVPFVVIRAISDKADGSADVDFTSFVELAANRSASIIAHLLQLL